MNLNISSILDEIIKEIKANDYSSTQNVVLLLPSNDPLALDEEEVDDDVGLSGNINLPVDVSGIVNIHTDDHIRRQIRENGKMEPKYLTSIPLGTKMAKLKMLLKGFPQLLDLSELELFDDEIYLPFIDFTRKYGNTQKNDPIFNINKDADDAQTTLIYLPQS